MNLQGRSLQGSAIALGALLTAMSIVASSSCSDVETSSSSVGNSSVVATSTAASTGTGAGGSPSASSSRSSTSTATDGSSSSSGTGVECVPIHCGNQLYECADCIDNDADGRVDGADTACLGACDDSEVVFGTSVIADLAPCQRDCYYDPDPGPGNDDCYWSYACDPLSVAPSYPPLSEPLCDHDPDESIAGTDLSCADLASQQSDSCVTKCGARTPNGCDCFGCCELPARSGAFVYVDSRGEDNESTCDDQSVADPSRCHPCTVVPSCFNPCDACDVCLGETAPPDGCAVQSCPDGQDACGQPGQELCPEGFQCNTGCCGALILL